MSGYISCCCFNDDVVGWIIQVRNELSISSTETIYLSNGVTRTVSREFSNVIALQCERSTRRLEITDIGSSLSGSIDQTDSNGFFDRRSFSDYLDLNALTGGTHPNGDPLYRVPADFPYTIPISVLSYPPGFVNTDCVAGPDTEKVARRDASAWNIIPPVPFQDHPGATYEITRDVNPDPFGTFSGVFEERENPVKAGGLLWDTRVGSGGFAGFDVGLGAHRIYEMIGDFPVDNITALNDLGMGTGVIVPNLDVTDTTLFPDFVCNMGPFPISRVDVQLQTDNYRCGGAQANDVFHRYSLINPFTGQLDREFEVNATRNQSIILLDPVYG